MTSARDLLKLGVLAEEAVETAGIVVREGFGNASAVEAKGPGDWVSEVDMRSEQVIRDVLAASGLPVFGEEAGGERGEVGWIVDPLDGTTNFLRGLPAVGISIALVEHGRPVVAAVGAPLLGDVFTAVEGAGAQRNGEPMRVSGRPIEQGLIATGLPFRHKRALESYLTILDAVFTRFEDVRRVGGASLDLAWTAAGVFDGYFELYLGPWDVAAGALLVREAGGIVTDWSGDAEAWLESGCIVAGSPHAQPALVELTRTRREDPV